MNSKYVTEMGISDIIEELVEIADTLRLKSQHNPMADDLYDLGERVDTVAEWVAENVSNED